MATVTFSMTSASSTTSTTMKNNSRVIVNYTAGNGSITVHSISGYRTDGYRTYGQSGSNQIQLTINGDTRTVGCSSIDFGANSSANAWTDFTDQTWSGLNGSYTLSVYVNSCNNTSHIQGCTWSGNIDAGYSTRHVTVRISNMDQYGNYGGSWVWIDTDVTYGSAVDYWGYGNANGPDNACYNVVRYQNSSVTSNIDTTVYASRQQYYLDVNGRLDGSDNGGLSTYGTVNVTVNGTKVATDVNDYYTQHYYGSTYKIDNIKPAVGCQYTGMAAGALEGTIEGTVDARLAFRRLGIYGKSSGGWVQGDCYLKTGSGWVKATDVYGKTSSGWTKIM